MPKILSNWQKLFKPKLPKLLARQKTGKAANKEVKINYDNSSAQQILPETDHLTTKHLSSRQTSAVSEQSAFTQQQPSEPKIFSSQPPLPKEETGLARQPDSVSLLSDSSDVSTEDSELNLSSDEYELLDKQKSSPDSALTNKFFRSIIKKAITTAMPSAFSGIDEMEKRYKQLNGRCEKLQKSFGRERVRVDKLRTKIEKAQGKGKSVSEEEMQQFSSAVNHLSLLENELKAVRESQQVLKTEIKAAKNQWETFQAELATLIANLRSLHQQKADDIAVHLSEFYTDTPDGRLVMKNLCIRPQDVRMENINGKKAIAITLDVPEMVLDVPVEGNVYPLNMKVQATSVTLRIDGKIASTFADYIEAPDTFSAGLKLVPLVRSVVQVFTGKTHTRPTQTGNSENENHRDTASHWKDKVKHAFAQVMPRFAHGSSKNLDKEFPEDESILPASISLNVGNLIAEIDHINESQVASLYASGRRQPHIQTHQISKLLCLPLQMHIDRLRLKTCNNPAYNDKSLDLELDVKHADIHVEAEKAGFVGNTGGENIRKARINSTVQSATVKGKKPLYFLSELGRTLRIQLPEADPGLNEVLAPVSSDIGEKITARVENASLSASYEMTQHAVPGKTDKLEWLANSVPDVSLKTEKLGLDVQGKVNIRGGLNHLSLKTEKESGCDVTTLSLGKPDEKHKSTLTLSGDGTLAHLGNKPLDVHGDVNVSLSECGQVCIKRSPSSDTLIVDAQQLPVLSLHTGKACSISLGDNQLQLPAQLAAKVHDLGVLAKQDKHSASHRSTIQADVRWQQMNLSGEGVFRYQKKGATGVTENKVESSLHGNISLTPSRFSCRRQCIHNEALYQMLLEKGGIEIDNVDIDGLQLKKARISSDSELNGKASFDGIALSAGILNSVASSPLSQLKLPRIMQFFLRNKTITANASCHVKCGKIDLNKIATLSLFVRPDARAGRFDRIMTRIINNGLKLVSGAVRKKLIQVRCTHGKMTLSSSLGKKFNYELRDKTIDSLAGSLGIDQQGQIHLPSVMQRYTGVLLLPVSARQAVDYQIDKIMRGDTSEIEQLLAQATFSLRDSISRPLGLYILKQFPWEKVSELAENNNALIPLLQQMLDLVIQQDEMVVQGIMLCEKLGYFPSEKEAGLLLDRCIELRKDLTALGNLLIKLPASERRDKLALQCFSVAARANPGNRQAHAECARLLRNKMDRGQKEQAQMLEHFKEAACLGDFDSYNALKSMAVTFEEAALVMVKVHLFYELHPKEENQLSSDIEGEVIPVKSQAHFNEVCDLLTRLSSSKTEAIKAAAMNIFISRCLHASKIVHQWDREHCEHWNNELSITRKQLALKGEKKSLWLTPQRCFNVAMSSMFCLNGQPQDLKLAKQLLTRVKEKHEMSAFYLNLLDRIPSCRV